MKTKSTGIAQLSISREFIRTTHSKPSSAWRGLGIYYKPSDLHKAYSAYWRLFTALKLAWEITSTNYEVGLLNTGHRILPPETVYEQLNR